MRILYWVLGENSKKIAKQETFVKLYFKKTSEMPYKNDETIACVYSSLII